LKDINAFYQPDRGFERRFIGCLDEKVGAKTCEEEIGSPTRKEWRDCPADSKNLGSGEGDIVGQQDEDAKDEPVGFS